LRYIITGLLIIAIMLISIDPLQAQTVRTHTFPGLGDYDAPFWPDGEYSPDIQSPDKFLGFTIGSKPVEHLDVLRYFSYLDQVCPYATLHSYGKTYEGRRLVYLSITSAENQNNLAEIRKKIAKLSDPRLLDSEAEAKRIISRTPAVAWMAYSIHGDELSSTDAALWLAYQLIAGTDEKSRLIRDNTVVCIDPLENPDGRTRWIGQLQQWNSAVPNTDTQSLHHQGFWTRGRGNHYLFDLNRDWFSVIHPETRGKVKAILDWQPQFLVDCHEMGSAATYMFSPPREPFNPYMISQIHKWWDLVAGVERRTVPRLRQLLVDLYRRHRDVVRAGPGRRIPSEAAGRHCHDLPGNGPSPVHQLDGQPADGGFEPADVAGGLFQ